MKAFRLFSVMALVGTLILAIAIRPAFAANPTISIHEAHAFEHVLETDDLLILVRYELPTDDWRSADYMVDHTCDDVDDLDDNCWNSLETGMVLHTLYDDDRDTGMLSGVRTISRIGHSLSGIYLEAGHGLTWDDTSYETCVEGSSTTFSPVPNACFTLFWHSSDDLASTSAVIEPYLVQMALNIEEEFPKTPTTFVNMDKITDEGVRFAREAFPAIMSVVPGAFFAGVDHAFDDFGPDATPTDLESGIETAAQASSVWQSAEDVAGEYFGMSVGTWGSVLTLLVAGVVVAAGARITGSAAMGVLVGSTVVGTGLFMDFLPIEPLWVVVAVMLVLGGSVIFARFPS